MKSKSIFVCFSSLLVGILLAAGCAKPVTLPPIKIGALLPLTGPNATNGPMLREGIDWKLSEINYEVAGRRIELLTEDDMSDANTSMDKVRKLVEQDKVDVVLGPLNSTAAMAVATYIAKSRTPNIAYMENTLDTVKLGGGFNFMPAGTLKGSAYFIGRYAYEKLGYRTVSALRMTQISSEEFVGGLIEGFVDAGGTCVEEKETATNVLDFTPYFATAKKADFFTAWYWSTVMPSFVTQYRSSGLKMPLILPNAWLLTTPNLPTIGDLGLGIMGQAEYNSDIDTDVNQAFVKAWTAKYGFAPDPHHLAGYVAAACFVEAVRSTGGDTTPEKIANALKTVKVQTPAGPYSFDAQGVGIHDMYIVVIVKEADKYKWKVVQSYSQQPGTAPSERK